MEVKIIREYWLQSKAMEKPKLEVLMEVDNEFIDIYRSETGDYSDVPDRQEFGEWINALMLESIEGENWIDG